MNEKGNSDIRLTGEVGVKPGTAEQTGEICVTAYASRNVWTAVQTGEEYGEYGKKTENDCTRAKCVCAGA